MSRTVRRKKFNSKKKFFVHYWECYSSQEVARQKYIDVWQYYGDNYYTKSCKDNKQFFKNVAFRMVRQDFRKQAIDVIKGGNDDVVLMNNKVFSIKYRIH